MNCISIIKQIKKNLQKTYIRVLIRYFFTKYVLPVPTNIARPVNKNPLSFIVN